MWGGGVTECWRKTRDGIEGDRAEELEEIKLNSN